MAVQTSVSGSEKKAADSKAKEEAFLWYKDTVLDADTLA